MRECDNSKIHISSNLLMWEFKPNTKGTIVTQTRDWGPVNLRQSPLNLMVNIHHASTLQKLMHLLKILSVSSTKQGENDGV
jgi:hypothetical protein